MTKNECANRIPSIEDHLNLSDWVFSPKFDQGENGDYHWISLHYHVEFEKYIPVLQHSQRVLVTQFDGFGGAAYCYENTSGWSTIGECAISDAFTERLPEVNYGADTALMFLDKPFTDQELLSGLSFANESPVPANERFWTLLKFFQPYLFVSYEEKEFFACKNKDDLDVLHSAPVLADVEEQQKKYCKQNRMTKWLSIGPECGPEKCVESNCDRLRIERAVRCYIHQLMAFGGLRN